MIRDRVNPVRAVVEVTLIALGVLLGLSAEAWLGSRGERRLEAYYLEALKTELEANVTWLSETIEEATEEAILNAMVAAETMTGRDGLTAHALPVDRLQEALRKYNRWVEPGSLPQVATVPVEELEALVGRYRSDGIPGESRIYVEDERLYIDEGETRRRIVRLTNGRLLLLGTAGAELEPASTDSTRLRVVVDGEVMAELEPLDDP